MFLRILTLLLIIAMQVNPVVLTTLAAETANGCGAAGTCCCAPVEEEHCNDGTALKKADCLCEKNHSSAVFSFIGFNILVKSNAVNHFKYSKHYYPQTEWFRPQDNVASIEKPPQNIIS